MDDWFFRPEFWTVENIKVSTLKYITVSSERRFIKDSYYIEISQLTCFANQLTVFYMIQVFTERYFRTDYNLIT